MHPSIKWAILGIFGVLLLALGLGVGYGVVPVVVDELVAENLDLWTEDSEGQKNFVQPPVDLYMKFWIYHVNNPDEVIQGGKPNVTEKGPYSYLEKRLKVDIRPGEGLNLTRIEFGQKKTYFFDEATSCEGCTKDDKVTVINAPLVGFVYQFATFPGISTYASRLNSGMKNEKFVLASRCENYHEDENGDYDNPQWVDSLFMEVSVDGLIFNGVKPGVVQQAFDCYNASMGTLYPAKLLQYDTGFAALNKRNDSAYYEYYSMKTGVEDMDEYYQIDKWGPLQDELYEDLTPARWWTSNGSYKGSNACNLLSGSDGQQFPPGVEDDDKLYVFATDICRSLFAVHQSDEDIDGIPVKRFYVPSEAFQLNTTANIGYCMEYEKNVPWDECIRTTDDPDILDISNCTGHPGYSGNCKDGVLDITKCMGDAPVIVSSPHFYQVNILGSKLTGKKLFVMTKPLQLFYPNNFIFKGPDELHEAIDGMRKPNPEEDETVFDIEPHLGMAVRIHKRLQFNTHLKPYDKIDVLNNVKETLFPIFWLEESADIDQANIDKLKDMLIKPLKMAEIGQWVAVGVGAALGLIGFVLFIIALKKGKRPNKPDTQGLVMTPIKM